MWWDAPSSTLHQILSDLLVVPGVEMTSSFDYTILSKLGDGMGGSVVKCQHKNTGELVAIKCIGASTLDSSEEMRQNVLREIRITASAAAAHKRIIGLSKIFVYDSRVFIVMEVAEGGDLFETIRARERGLGEEEALGLFRQMVEAVFFLHEHGISHRDVKPENFLITAAGEVKLCDFGFCASFFRGPDDHRENQNTDALPFGTPCGTKIYLAPEILLGQRYTQAVDIWSLGVSLYVMLSGENPWRDPIRDSILTGDFIPLSHISAPTDALLRMIMEPDPTKRPTAKQLREQL